MVLGTDMRAHFEHLTKFKSSLAGEKFANQASMERKDMRLLLVTALHAADISNPAKPQQIATAWAKRYAHTQHNHGASTLSLSPNTHHAHSFFILTPLAPFHTYPPACSLPSPFACSSMEEFFQQGDREMELGLSVSPFMDRSKVPLAATIVNCQIGFINVLVRPLLCEWAVFLGDSAERDIVNTLEGTLRLWETSGAKVIDSWGDFATKSDASKADDVVVELGKKGTAAAGKGPRATTKGGKGLTTKGDESHRVKV